MAASIVQLAERAFTLYQPVGVTVDMYALWLKDGWDLFVHECGQVYSNTDEITLTAGTWEYDLPSDYRRLMPHGVYLYYAERDISTISRTSNVTTVVTSTVHGLATGSTVVIDDVTPVGDDEFDTDSDGAEVTVSDTTTFTYANTGDNDSGGGGTVNAMETDEQFLAHDYMSGVSGVAGWNRTEGAVTYYFFPGAVSIGFHDVPNGEAPTAWLYYDAETPSTFDNTVALPVPSYAERGLVGYAHEQAALQAGDVQRAAIGRGLFDETCNRWRAASVDREQTESRNALDTREGRTRDQMDDLENPNY